MLKVTVDRTKWLRASNQGSLGSYLLRREDNLMCCLGFACIALGLTEEQIKEVGEPMGLPEDIAPKQFVEVIENKDDYGDVEIELKNTPRIDELININDDKSLDDNEREIQLIEIGKKAGIEFEFVN